MEAALISVAFVLILLGCAFVFLPGLPGPIVAWAGPFVYFAFSKAPPEEALPFIGAGTLVASAVLALLALAFDFFSSWWGAAKFGATWRGGLGAIIGSVLGIFMQPFFVWIFIMPFIMAFNFGSAILRSIGDTRRPLYILVIAGCINTVLNLVFVLCLTTITRL